MRFHGLPGNPNMPTWVRLSRTALESNTTIRVDADLAGLWPIGAQIAVASTDYDRFQTESFIISRVDSTGTGESIISLDKPLKYMHYGNADSLPDNSGLLNERAEVALISRNIVITGTDEPSPFDLEGHFFSLLVPKIMPFSNSLYILMFQVVILWYS